MVMDVKKITNHLNSNIILSSAPIASGAMGIKKGARVYDNQQMDDGRNSP